MPEVRLIDANALKTHVCNMCDDGQRECIGDESCAILCWINDMPTIEAEPVRHGHWVHHSDVKTWEEWETCSNCGEKRPIDYDEYRDGAFGFANGCFCNSCGTKMDSTDTNDGGKGGNI